MQPVREIVARAVPLDRSDVDTDQIIPSDWLKRVERTGFGEGLFSEWRESSDFVLNQEQYAGAQILVAGPNFGCGSSREHAPWALEDYGFQAIIAPSFADIFRSNCTKIGLLPVELPEQDVRELLDRAPEPVTIDLEAQTVTLPSGRVTRFEFDPMVKERLLNGWDEIALTENRIGEVERYEAERERAGPDTLAL